MATAYYHITFRASDAMIIEADVKTDYVPGDGFDDIKYQNVVVSTSSGRCTFHDCMPPDYVSEADYEAEGKLPENGESDPAVENRWDDDLYD